MTSKTNKQDVQPSAKRTSSKASGGFTAEERAAMKEYVQEQKRNVANENGESDLLAKIAEMPEADRAVAERIHAIIKATAPNLSSRTWYGMPAYAKDGDEVCFFQAAAKFTARYTTLGLSRQSEP